MIDLAVRRLTTNEAVAGMDSCVTTGPPTLDEVLTFSDIDQIAVDRQCIDARRPRQVFDLESAEGTAPLGLRGEVAAFAYRSCGMSSTGAPDTSRSSSILAAHVKGTLNRSSLRATPRR